MELELDLQDLDDIVQALWVYASEGSVYLDEDPTAFNERILLLIDRVKFHIKRLRLRPKP